MTNDTKTVIREEQFGRCPHCGRLMYMLHSKFNLYGLSESGRYPTMLLHKEDDYIAKCLCGFECPMANTIEGTVPKNYYKLTEEEESNKEPIKTNLIGYVVKETKNTNERNVEEDGNRPT